jgi:hypothetical protein
MSSRRRDIRGILADPELRRQLMVPVLQATQAREGIDTTTEQAERAYYVVTEAEFAAFFALESSRALKGAPERRHESFVKAIRSGEQTIRFDVARRDFGALQGALLVYRDIGWLRPLFLEFPSLMPAHGRARSGLNTTEIDQFTRFRWEVSSGASASWVMFAKGGNYSRFYTDFDIVFDWTRNGAEFKSIVASKYGSPSRFVKSEDDYFKSGITWMQTTNLGLNARLLPPNGIFGVASPSFFPDRSEDTFAILAVLNSSLFDAMARCVANRNWGATAIGSLPFPHLDPAYAKNLGQLASSIVDAKSSWDGGNEVSARFEIPWLLRNDHLSSSISVCARLDSLVDMERSVNAEIQASYERICDCVFSMYGIKEARRRSIEMQLGDRPPEVVWPQMEGKSSEQKRMEHVWRLLSYLVKRVVEADDDGIVPFDPINGEAGLAERVRRELGAVFPGRDVTAVEVEIANELKVAVKGYRRTSGIDEWLRNAFFEYHASLYKGRPILWHIASIQGAGACAFGAIVHYHRFDKNRMAKLRSGYLRDAIEGYRRDAGLADKEGRAADRTEAQARLEEAQALDRRLQAVQEGLHEGPEGGERDFRILTPWKSASERPKDWNPDLDDGVAVNIAPMERAGVLRVGKVS